MSLTRKHFELIAEAIRVERPTLDQHHNPENLPSNKTLDRVADNLATQFRMINPRFDHKRFLLATRRG